MRDDVEPLIASTVLLLILIVIYAVAAMTEEDQLAHTMLKDLIVRHSDVPA